MKLILKKGSTSRLTSVLIQDSSFGDGRGLASLVYNSSGLACYYMRPDGGITTVSLQTMTISTWASGGFIEVDSSKVKGLYQFGIPDACLATGATHCDIFFVGAVNQLIKVLNIELTDMDLHDAVRGGMTALPNAAAGAAGGLSLGQNPFFKNTAYSNFTFIMYDSTNHAPVTGKSVTATRSIDGAAYGACANAVSEVATGLYKINLAAADLNGASIALRFTAAGSDDVNITLPMVV